MLLAGLPASSRTSVALHGPAALWDSDDYLLALIADLLAAGNWQRAGDARRGRPKPVPRPGDTTHRLTGAELRERLEDLNRRRAAEKAAMAEKGVT